MGVPQLSIRSELSWCSLTRLEMVEMMEVADHAQSKHTGCEIIQDPVPERGEILKNRILNDFTPYDQHRAAPPLTSQVGYTRGLRR
eukprot:gene25825-biopygen9131